MVKGASERRDVETRSRIQNRSDQQPMHRLEGSVEGVKDQAEDLDPLRLARFSIPRGRTRDSSGRFGSGEIEVDGDKAAVQRVDTEPEFFERRRAEENGPDGWPHQHWRASPAALTLHVHLAHRPLLRPPIAENDSLSA